MKKSPDINSILEVFWLIVAILTAIVGSYTAFADGLQPAYPFLIMSFLSVLLYLARRSIRRKKSE